LAKSGIVSTRLSPVLDVLVASVVSGVSTVLVVVLVGALLVLPIPVKLDKAASAAKCKGFMISKPMAAFKPGTATAAATTALPTPLPTSTKVSPAWR
jgi:hypothetical protein